MLTETLYDDGAHSWHFFGRDETRPDRVIDTNEYLVMHDGKGAMLDPGGAEIFPQVVTAISRKVGMENVEVIFASHQDPDILSSLALWMKLCPNATAYAPEIWRSFICHFDYGAKLEGIPDEGGFLPFAGTRELECIPAHYLHSSGNFSVYDKRAKILWSGDIGSALLPPDDQGVFVEDFDKHIRYMEGFHRRWMPSERARDRWVARVRDLDFDFLCPQHGAIFPGEMAHRFIEWFSYLELAKAIDV